MLLLNWIHWLLEWWIKYLTIKLVIVCYWASSSLHHSINLRRNMLLWDLKLIYPWSRVYIAPIVTKAKAYVRWCIQSCVKRLRSKRDRRNLIGLRIIQIYKFKELFPHHLCEIRFNDVDLLIYWEDLCLYISFHIFVDIILKPLQSLFINLTCDSLLLRLQDVWLKSSSLAVKQLHLIFQ